MLFSSRCLTVRGGYHGEPAALKPRSDVSPPSWLEAPEALTVAVAGEPSGTRPAEEPNADSV